MISTNPQKLKINLNLLGAEYILNNNSIEKITIGMTSQLSK
jgi:hypothetical protein